MSSDQRRVAGDLLVPPLDHRGRGGSSLPWFTDVDHSSSIAKNTNLSNYVKRSSGIAVTSERSSLQKLSPKTSPKSSENNSLVVRMPSSSDLKSKCHNVDGGTSDSAALAANGTKPQPGHETPVYDFSNSDPNHLRLLASRHCHVPEAQLPTAANSSNQFKLHRPAALIVPEAQSLLARLERDSKKFTKSALPLYVKTLQRNERRHQRVILGADAIRAQKLDI
jgi:hypothetical protein